MSTDLKIGTALALVLAAATSAMVRWPEATTIASITMAFCAGGLVLVVAHHFWEGSNPKLLKRTYAIVGVAFLATAAIIIGAKLTSAPKPQPLPAVAPISPLAYEVCFTHRSRGRKVAHVWVWTKLINRNSFAIPVEIEDNSLTLGKYASTAQMRRNQLLVASHTNKAAITDDVEISPPLSPPEQLQGYLNYKLRYGRDAKHLDYEVPIKGFIDQMVLADGKSGVASFSPDVDSDPNFTGRQCTINWSGPTYVVAKK